MSEPFLQFTYVNDETRIGLLLVDLQNTFCLPEFELYVGGRSGKGAIEDNIRLCQFIYHNLHRLTQIIITMDTHVAMQIFHPIFWINEKGEHPTPTTIISHEDIEQEVWHINPAIVPNFPKWSLEGLEAYALHYARHLDSTGKYPLMIWPYHANLGSISHALVSSVEEALFFYSVARKSQVQYEIKGNNPLTEHYSVLRPEVTEDQHGNAIAQENRPLIEQLLSFDQLLIAGQAKSHCVAWTVDDLLTEIQQKDPKLANKVYLLEDCTSPVVIPNGTDFTEQAAQEFTRFKNAGMSLIDSTSVNLLKQ
ncbi:cysteine hydrolase family protein [Euhalothece natronophila]|uniref:isochorismatase n=1 Tax=Euhalothece natronophila TaxID=577489 RepID=UPI001C997B33|nr:isochorismatase [Euhalothece natronophila]